MQIATAGGEEISLLLSEVCVTKSDALSVYRRAVANLTIQNGGGAIRRRRMSRDPASGRRLFSSRSPCRRPPAVNAERRRLSECLRVERRFMDIFEERHSGHEVALSQRQGCQVVEARRGSGARDGAPYAESRMVPQPPFQLCVRTPCTSPSRFHFTWLCDDRSKARGNAFILWPRSMKCHFDLGCGWIV